MGAIYIGDDHLSEINQDACVECQACYKGMSVETLPQQPTRFLRGLLSLVKLRFQPDPDICPTGAITQDELVWPRILRRQFSDPQEPHPSTGVGGRGTMGGEDRRCDGPCKGGGGWVHNRVRSSGVGSCFSDVEALCRRLARMGVEFQTENPVMRSHVRCKHGTASRRHPERASPLRYSEFKAKANMTAPVLNAIEEEVKKLDTVVALGPRFAATEGQRRSPSRVGLDGIRGLEREIEHGARETDQRGGGGSGEGHMTNTLHRFGKPGGLKDDYVAFVLTSKGANDVGSREKARAFLEVALRYNPVNLAGDTRYGSLYRPEKHLNPFSLYMKGRKEKVPPATIVDEMPEPGRALVVFDNKQSLEGFLKEIKKMDLGLSVNVSALVDDVREMASVRRPATLD